MSTCRDCGQEIQWIDGKPFDMTPASHWRNRQHIEATRGKPRPARSGRPALPPPSGKDGGATQEDYEHLMRLIEGDQKEEGSV